MIFGAGLGVNHQLNENNLLVMAVELFGMQKSKQDFSDSSGSLGTADTTLSTLPGFYMGVESKIKPWLTGRLGVAQVYQSLTGKEKPEGLPETKSTRRQSQYKVSFGLGISFGDFILDAAINEGLFFDGPNFISGGVNAMANKLSVTYKF
jgi:hypothetical protein